MEDHLPALKALLVSYAVPLAGKISAAIALWILGGYVVRLIVAATRRVMAARRLDHTLARYTENFLRITLQILLAVAALGVLGVATTSFAALLAAAGVALGMAWSGLLANFAAGFLLVMLRPFRVGDTITLAGVTGMVREIGLFACVIDNNDNVRVLVGNNKIFSENIINYSANGSRRFEVKVQLAHEIDIESALQRLVDAVRPLPGVRDEPAPEAVVIEFNQLGALASVRMYVAQADYQRTLAAAHRALGNTIRDSGWPIPESRSAQRTVG
jgi:small conductance mechanosensitive channel